MAEAPDAVIVATGTEDTKPAIAGANGGHVFTARQVLSGANLGRRVVIGDWDGKHMGMSVAEFLATRGHAVELVTGAFFVGMDADLLTWRPAMQRLQNLGRGADAAGRPFARRAWCRGDSPPSRTERMIAADSVVLCHRGRADRRLYHALKGRVATLHAIGDCWAPRQIEQAILEGAKVARAV